jgi:perosamine synthetase
MKKILGAEPFYFNQEKEIIKKIGEIIISGQLSSGKFVKMFEKKFSDFFGSKYSIAVNSGGTGLELALEALNIKGKEVLMPTQTFIATPNSVVRAGGKPIFCDIDRNTGCLNPEDVLKKISKKTAGIIFVPMFGIMPQSIIKIKKICKEKGIFLMEDAAHAHGASINNKKAGVIGDISVFSFYATKILTTGEGGMIVTNNRKLNEKCLILRNHGRSLKN